MRYFSPAPGPPVSAIKMPLFAAPGDTRIVVPDTLAAIWSTPDAVMFRAGHAMKYDDIGGWCDTCSVCAAHQPLRVCPVPTHQEHDPHAAPPLDVRLEQLARLRVPRARSEAEARHARGNVRLTDRRGAVPPRARAAAACDTVRVGAPAVRDVEAGALRARDAPDGRGRRGRGDVEVLRGRRVRVRGGVADGDDVPVRAEVLAEHRIVRLADLAALHGAVARWRVSG